jgi:hypothetical protein
MTDQLVRRADFSIEEPWMVPRQCVPVALRRAVDGSTPRLKTEVAIYYDRDYLSVLFRCRDDEVVAHYLEHDQPLYEEDVVEVFLSIADVRHYYELEVNPLGTTFDARIDSPDGVRATMTTDIDWTCDGLFAAVRRVPGATDTVMRIPFGSIDTQCPRSGETWRGNFFRIDRSRSHGDEFSAWRPTLKNPADFHVTAVFGALRFE